MSDAPDTPDEDDIPDEFVTDPVDPDDATADDDPDNDE